MYRSSLFAAAFALLFAAACGSGGSSSSSSSGGGGSAAGTVGGKSFAIASGIGHLDKDGSLDLILSDAPGLCDAIQAQKFAPGTTIVQAYGLVGKAPGAFKSDHEDVKYATVSPTCPSGQPIGEQNVAKAGRAKTTTIEVTTLGDTSVEGTIDVTFDDGSSVSGSFSVPMCSQSQAEKATCS
jgi:hypothetical protein